MVYSIYEIASITSPQFAALLEGTLLLQCICFMTQPNSKLQEATWAFFVNSLISHDEKDLIMIIFLRLDKTSRGELDH